MKLTRRVVDDYAHVYTDSPERRVHLVLSSGRHADGYVNFDPATTDTQAMWYLASELARACLDKLLPGLNGLSAANPAAFGNLVVVTPPWGSIRLADYFALQLQWLTNELVLMALIEKDPEGNFYIEREGHQAALEDAAVIVIEDVSTTGKNTRKAINLAESYGGRILAVGSVWNRGGVTNQQLGLRENVLNFSLIDTVLADWDKNQCPLCDAHVPIATDVGHGAKFQTLNPDYGGGYTTIRS